MEQLCAPLSGEADSQLLDEMSKFASYLRCDPDYSFQVVAYVGGRIVLDAWGGPHFDSDALSVPYSVSKNIIGVSIALLVQRGELDLDERVALYWPEFGQAGKKAITVRQLLSHQAGLPDATPRLTWDELLDHHRAADRLAKERPLWHPGSAFGYHGITIGNLASELVFRVSGRTLHDFYEQEIRATVGADFYLGLPDALATRRVDVLPMIPPLAQIPERKGSALGSWLMAPRDSVDMNLGNDPRSWRFGHPAASATGSARGIALLMAAAVTGIGGAQPLLSRDTVEVVAQQQVRGYDEVLDQHDRAHGVVFQKPSAQLAWGGPRSFGHDGAFGAIACADPDSGLAFAYTVARGPWPGGADPRAIRLAGVIGKKSW